MPFRQPVPEPATPADMFPPRLIPELGGVHLQLMDFLDETFNRRVRRIVADRMPFSSHQALPSVRVNPVIVTLCPELMLVLSSSMSPPPPVAVTVP